MKLLPTILFLLAAAGVAPKILVTNGHFTQLQPRRLEGPDINDIKLKLDEAIKQYGWTSEIASPTSLMVSVQLGGRPVNFFEVSTLEKPPGPDGKTKTYIVVSNLPKKIQDPTFARFHRYKVYARQTASSEPGADQKFLENYAQRFYQAHERVLTRSGVYDMFENLKKLVAEGTVQNVVLVERSNTQTSIVFDLNNKQNGKLVAQVVVYPVSDEYVGVSFSHRDDVSYFNVPVDNLAGYNPDIVRVMVDKNAKVGNKLTGAEVKAKILDKIRGICATNAPTINQMNQSPSGFVLKVDRSGQTMMAAPGQMCPFVDGDVIVNHYSQGYMQYFHLMFNSRFLREEYIMVTTSDKIDGNIEKAFQMIKGDTETAHKMAGGQAKEVDVKLADLKKAFEVGIGEAPMDDPFSEEELRECTESGNKCEAKLKFPNKDVVVLLYINREGWLISATRVVPSTKMPLTIQISTPLKNSGDQRPSIIQHMKQFMGAV